MNPHSYPEVDNPKSFPSASVPCPFSPTGRCDHEVPQLCGGDTQHDYCRHAARTLRGLAVHHLIEPQDYTLKGADKTLNLLVWKERILFAYIVAGTLNYPSAYYYHTGVRSPH